MTSPYHLRGHLRSLLKPAWLHVRECARNPAYRALHRFSRQLRRVSPRTPRTIRFAGRPIRLIDGPSFLSAWDEIFVNRIYDISSERKQPLLVDVGANIGLAALFWKMQFKDCRYLGFEPDPQIARICRANLHAWNVAGELKDVAISGVAGIRTFVSDHTDSGHLADGTDNTSTIDVTAETLSPHLTEPIDLLKIDIEGAEREVLFEATPKLSLVKNLFVEWHCTHSSDTGLGTAIQLLEDEGFRVAVQVAAGPDQPFSHCAPTGRFVQHLNLYAVRL